MGLRHFKGLMGIALVFIISWMTAFDAQARESSHQNYILPIPIFQNLSPKKQARYIKKVRKVFVEIENRQRRDFAEHSTPPPSYFSWLINYAYALPVWMNPNCLFAGHISKISEVKTIDGGTSYKCERPPQGDCLKEQIQCNKLLYGNYVCINPTEFKSASKSCLQKAKPIWQILEDISKSTTAPAEWLVLEQQIGIYCGWQESRSSNKPKHTSDDYPCEKLKAHVQELSTAFQRKDNSNGQHCTKCKVDRTLRWGVPNQKAWGSIDLDSETYNDCKFTKLGDDFVRLDLEPQNTKFNETISWALNEDYFRDVFGGRPSDWMMVFKRKRRQPFTTDEVVKTKYEEGLQPPLTFKGKKNVIWRAVPETCELEMSIPISLPEGTNTTSHEDIDKLDSYFRDLKWLHSSKFNFLTKETTEVSRPTLENLQRPDNNQINLSHAISHMRYNGNCEDLDDVASKYNILVSGSKTITTDMALSLTTDRAIIFHGVDSKKPIYIHKVNPLGEVNFSRMFEPSEVDGWRSLESWIKELEPHKFGFCNNSFEDDIFGDSEITN